MAPVEIYGRRHGGGDASGDNFPAQGNSTLHGDQPDPARSAAGQAARGDAILADVGMDVLMIESQMAIIRSTILLRRVVEKEHLALIWGASHAHLRPLGRRTRQHSRSFWRLFVLFSIVCGAGRRSPRASWWR